MVGARGPGRLSRSAWPWRSLVAAAELAGHLAGFQIGFSYAAVVDPQSGVRNNVVAALYGNLAMVTFLGINGHHSLVRALVGSYEALPIGAVGVSGPIGGDRGRTCSAWCSSRGTRLAAPVVTALLLVEIVMGLIARAAPATEPAGRRHAGPAAGRHAGARRPASRSCPGSSPVRRRPRFEAAIRLMRAFH